MSLSSLGFARPELLGLALLVPLLLVLLLIAERARRRASRAFGGNAALSARSATRIWIRNALLLLALASLVVALAGPYVDLRQRGARRLGVDIVLAIDVSQSMAVRDVTPDRLRAARHIAQEIGERMVSSRVSLVLFKGAGTLRYPPTTDPKILGEVLDNSGKGLRFQEGSSLAAAYQTSLSAFPTDGDPRRGRAIVIVSDGEITVGDTPDTAQLQGTGVRLFTIGVGTPTGAEIPTYNENDGKFTGYLRGPDGRSIISKLEEASLQKMATDAGGRYWRFAGDDGVLGELASELHGLEAVEPVENAGSVPDEKSQLFVALAVAAILIERLMSDRRRMPSPRVARVSSPRRGRRILGIAIGSALLWAMACGDGLPSAAQANGMFARGDYQAALAAYRDLQKSAPDAPELSINAGNSLHMLKDYSRALPDYAKAIDATDLRLRAIAQYDRGNTLFRLGRLEDARDAYRETLRLEPDDRDAKFNLEIVQALLDGRRKSQPPGAQTNAPGDSGSSGGTGASGASGPRASGSPQPGQPGTPTSEQGDPTTDQANPGQTPPDLRGALSDFRVGLTLDDALRVLDALDGQQRGIAQLIEGPRRGDRQNPEY